jgi:hypothetical protein
VQVGGGGNSADNSFNQKVTNTISGANGTLLVLGNSQTSGLANQLNFQVRQNAGGVGVAIPNLTTLDMSGLGTLIAMVGKFYVAQGGNGASQTNVSGCVYLARTNVIICLRANAGQFEVGDSSTGTNTLPGSALYLGITNAFFVDTMRIGKNSATNNLTRRSRNQEVGADWRLWKRAKCLPMSSRLASRVHWFPGMPHRSLGSWVVLTA